MPEYYWVLINKLKRGPFTIGQLRSMWEVGTLTPLTHYSKDGANDWAALSTLFELHNSETLTHTRETVTSAPPTNSLVSKATDNLFPTYSPPPKQPSYARPFYPSDQKATPKADAEIDQITSESNITRSDDSKPGTCSIGCIGLLIFLACIYYAIFNAITTKEKITAIVLSIVIMIIFGVSGDLVDGYFKRKETQKRDKALEARRADLEEQKRLRAREEAMLPTDPYERAWALHRKTLPAHSISSLEKESYQKEEFRLRWEGDHGPWKKLIIKYSARAWAFPGCNEWQANYLARSVARQFTLEFPGASVEFYQFDEGEQSCIDDISLMIEKELDPYAKHAKERLLSLIKEAQSDIRFSIKEFFEDSSYLTTHSSAETIRQIMHIVEPYGWPDFEDKISDLSVKDVFFARIAEIERNPTYKPSDPLLFKDRNLFLFRESWRYGRRHQTEVGLGIRFTPPSR